MRYFKLTKQVEITNRDGHILRGIVNIPEDGTRFPAIVNVHGFTGNKSGYKSIYTHTARLLAEHGFAVLIYTEMVKVMVNSRT